jgi:hypothetical protein
MGYLRTRNFNISFLALLGLRSNPAGYDRDTQNNIK